MRTFDVQICKCANVQMKITYNVHVWLRIDNWNNAMRKNFIIEKKAKRILIASMILILVPLVALIYLKVSNDLSGTDLILKKASDMSFHGRVDSIYFDKQNHNTETLVLSDGYFYGLYSEWSSLVVVGDSLAKDAGSLKVMVYKKDKKVNVLDYKQLVKDWK